MYSIIDIESNGGAYRKEKIIELAIYKYDGHKIVDQFICLINPEDPISPFVQKLTGISQKMVKTAPKFHEIAKRILEITQDTLMIGHNVDFDYRMLRQSFKDLGYHFEIDTLDTIPLAKRLIPDEKSYSLEKLCKSIGIPINNVHRASGDARATLELFNLLLAKDQNHEIIQSHRQNSRFRKSLNRIENLIENLPEEKGIIYFQNAKGDILLRKYAYNLYVVAKKTLTKQSKNLKNLQENTSQIHYELTGTEIIAHLMMRTLPILMNFGIYENDGTYFVNKISLEKEKKPLMKMKTFSQGKILLECFKNKKLEEDLASFVSLKNRNEVWVSKGRKLGEKSFLIIKNGVLSGYGFYEFPHQIESLEKIKKNTIPVDYSKRDLENLMKLGLLKNEFLTLSLPK